MSCLLTFRIALVGMMNSKPFCLFILVCEFAEKALIRGVEVIEPTAWSHQE